MLYERVLTLVVSYQLFARKRYKQHQEVVARGMLGTSCYGSQGTAIP